MRYYRDKRSVVVTVESMRPEWRYECGEERKRAAHPRCRDGDGTDQATVGALRPFRKTIRHALLRDGNGIASSPLGVALDLIIIDLEDSP